MRIELSHRLEPQLKQTLELVLSPKMIQMLKILNLPYIELVEKMRQEAEENVMLDVERKDEFLEYIKYITSDRRVKKEVDFTEYPGMENIKAKKESLEEHLMHQLELENLDENYQNICEYLIRNLDDRGFITNYTEVREKIMEEIEVSRPIVDKALKIIQGFEPDGVGARSLKECLLIQIKEYNFETYELEKILAKAVSKHFDDLAAQNYEKVARSLGIEKSGVERIAEFIRVNLNPNPGAAFSPEAQHVIPSFAVEEGDKGYKVVNLERKYGPILRISSEYKRMLEDPKTDKEALKFLKEKLMAARNLMENIAKRYETTEKIVELIRECQPLFLEKGIIWLRPLMQKDIAEKLGLHPSTISRAIAEKYVQTPQGLFPIKFLCPRSHKGHTTPRVKSMIVEIIKNEDKKHPLSDEEIRNILVSEGINIKRRTVASYREKLKISSSSERKEKQFD